MSNYTSSFFAVSVMLFLIACGGARDFEYCSDHFDFADWISQESERVMPETAEAMKIISTSDGNSADSIPMTSEELKEVFSGMTEFNIGLPNLIGRYSCTESSGNNNKTRTEFLAGDDRLSVRFFRVEQDGSGEVFKLEGHREVGSVLASMDKEFMWDAGDRELRIDIDYKSMLGADKSYRIVVFY
jgi:hypothetical protein